MTTDTLIAAADDTNAGQQDVTPTAAAPEAPQGDPAQTPPQENAADGAQDGETPTAPEYEPFTVPDGIAVDEEVLGEFKAIAKDLNLSQEAAQQLADLSTKMVVKQQEQFRETQTQWIDAARTDKEFGGDKFTENLGVAKTALDAFASPELRQLLNESGLGNHPEVIRAFVRIGKQISIDGTIVRGMRADHPSDPAKRLFPNQN